MADIHTSPRVRCLAQVADPRLARATRHAWPDMLVRRVGAPLGGADHRVAMEDLGQAHPDGRQTLRPWPHGLPSPDTVGRVWAWLEAVQFEACFRDWVPAACARTQGPRVAMDGQRVRHAWDAGAPLGPGPTSRGPAVPRDGRHACRCSRWREAW